MLQIKKLNLTHKKDLRVILDDFNLVLNDGDKAVIIGEEGNGKSTLMKWIYDPSLIENYIEADGERVMGNERLGYWNCQEKCSRINSLNSICSYAARSVSSCNNLYTAGG